MIEREIQVVARHGNYVSVEAQKISGCSHCGASSVCGTSILGKWMQKKNHILVPNTFDLHVGDQAVIGIEENELIKASFFVYLFPVLFMLITAVLVSNHTENQGLIALAGLAGLLAGVYIMRSSTGKRCPVMLLRKTTRVNLVTSTENKEA